MPEFDEPEESTKRDAYSAPRPVSLFPAGTRVDRYVVLSTLGKGGMGAVYAAYDFELDRRVALKFLLPQVAGAEDAEAYQARLLLEARAMARLSHPNVVTLYQVGPAPGGGIYLAMELVEGGTLTEWLKTKHRGWREILAMLCEAGEGLAAAHRAGLVHRDFKLDNVLVRKDGRPQVTDFGVVRGGSDPAPEHARGARPFSERMAAAAAAAAASERRIPAAPISSLSLSNLTLTGSLLGTPGYMAPEQYTMETDIDARADVFAFCATLYRALYGKRPFDGKGLEEVAESTVLGRVREPPAGSDVPGWLRAAVFSGLKVVPSERPPSMDVLLEALRADPWKRWRRWAVTAAVGVTCGALAFGIHATSERRVRSCQAASNRGTDAWDEATKEAIAKSFHATSLGYADDTWKRTERRLTDYASEWSKVSYEVCAATRVRGEQSESMMELRTECLDERMDELRAITGIFKSADRETVQNAVKVVSALPRLEPCSNLDRLSVATRLPQDPHARGEIRELRAKVAEATELRLAGRETKGRQLLEQIRGRVQATGHGPVLVAFTMEEAQGNAAGDAKASAEGWKQAVALSDRYRLDRERAQSEIELGGAYDDLGQHSDAELWFNMASETLTRIGGEPHFELKRGSLLGLTYYQEGKYKDAVRTLMAAIEKAKKNGIEDPRSLMNAHSFLAFALTKDDSSLSEAVTYARKSVTVAEQAFGRDHPSVNKMLVNLAPIELVAGRYDDALSTTSRSIGAFELAIARGELPAHHIVYGVALSTKATVLLRLDRPSEAIAPLEQARAIDRKGGRRDYLLNDDVTLAEALRRLGRPAEALRACTEGEEIANEDKETRAEDLVTLRTVQARLALDAKETAHAISYAERAVAGAETGVADTYDLAMARFVLARAIAKGKRDPARARALAAKAKEGFAKLHDTPRVEEATALLGDVR